MILYIVEAIIALLLVGAILLQSQGGGLSSTFGGSGGVYRSKRNIEKLLMWATVFLAIIFAIVSILLLIRG
ncbi:preprotein translocase subunit SecG [Patescibacteria group bacterium]|nr:preprotein translocase subunit SecG [Patescibacteria group bacterium]